MTEFRRILLDGYPCQVERRGDELVAADGRALARALRVAGKVEPLFVESVNDLPSALIDTLRDGDVLLTMGAGSIGGTAAKLFEALGAVAEQ